MIFKRVQTYFFFIGVVLLVSSCGISKGLDDRPDISKYDVSLPERTKISDSTYVMGDNFLTKNKQGLWEMHVKGNPLELGLYQGALAQELFNQQEDVFLKKIDELVPSKGYQNILRKFLAWFNRKIYLHIDEQYKTEIYGISQYASPQYDHIAVSRLFFFCFLGKKYQRWKTINW